jgi:hypothetical protein
MKRKKSKVLVGTFQLGLRYINLFIDFSTENASVSFLPIRKGVPDLPVMVVGADTDWGEVLSTLLHEAYELTFVDLSLRYKKRPSWTEESSEFYFWMHHNDLAEAHERIGPFLAKVVPEVKKIYDARNKKRK